MFLVEARREREQEGVVVGSATTEAQVEVLRSGALGYLLSWSQGEPEADRMVSGNLLLARAVAAAADLRFEILLHPDGSYDGLRNEREISRELQRSSEQMIDEVLRMIPDEDTRVQVSAALDQAISPQALLDSATREIRLFFGLGGVPLRLGEALELTAHAPLSTSTPGVSTLVTYTGWDPAHRWARVEVWQTFNSDTMRRMMQEMASRTGQPVGDEIPVPLVVDTAVYLVDIETMRIAEVRFERTMEATGRRRLDRVLLRTVPA